MITLPLVGKPLPDSSEVFRIHIFKTQWVEEHNSNNDRSKFHKHGKMANIIVIKMVMFNSLSNRVIRIG